jgi:hypothetical protein
MSGANKSLQCLNFIQKWLYSKWGRSWLREDFVQRRFTEFCFLLRFARNAHRADSFSPKKSQNETAQN